MDDRLRETLSAMMDDQADELAVRRVLSHHDQQAVRDQWQRWQRIRDVIHEAPHGEAGVDVREAVRASLDQSAVAEVEQRQTMRRRHAPWRWSAVAMIALGVAIGFGAGSGWDVMSQGAPENLVPVQARVPAVTSGAVPEVALHGLDDRQREQISRYLLEHAQNNGMGAGPGALGYARVTSVSGPGY
ncbi:sigma-E factor negative regulatory protein [Marinobacter bryozoorum]|uniref:sigma-E factor negative regulatory protein n=1 Tax=Marinobacter bryozoorum TaxID=256324 RepID=UPI0020038014|nr:sigma-E factor negative regulatory protein [Marinobacter bryozoorum]MCK7544430.1 sigma-E factor negative regulatory protein [Marinobacter bryozoorum]